MGPPPAGFLIESLLVPRNTVPAIEVRPIVLANGLDDMSGLAITAFAAMGCGVLDRHRLIYQSSHYVLLYDERQSARFGSVLISILLCARVNLTKTQPAAGHIERWCGTFILRVIHGGTPGPPSTASLTCSNQLSKMP